MRRIRSFVLLAALVLVPFGAAAQQTAGAIGGAVRDASGAMVPGVTVEVSSAALIEKVRTASTDGSGRYLIVSLPPGRYDVKFGLEGFGTYERRGVEVSTGVTANVNAELKIGTLEETVTVSGAAPIVDVQNVQKQAILDKQTMTNVPAARVWSGYAALLPGVTLTANNVGAQYDVGGGGGVDGQRLSYQGSTNSDITIQINGMPIVAEWNSIAVAPSELFLEETVVGLGSQPAETETGGVRTNLIPKSGGNRFAGQSQFTFTNSRLQGSNVTDQQFNEGVPRKNGINQLSEVAVSFGGPVARNKLWFYSAGRYVGTNRQSSVFFDKVVNDWVYTPDTSRESVPDTRPSKDFSTRLTYQLGKNDQLSANVVLGSTLRCCNSLAPTYVLEESDRSYQTNEPIIQVMWTKTVSSRLLLEAGGQYARLGYYIQPQPTAVFPAVTETSTGVRFRSKSGRSNRVWQDTMMYSHFARFSASYVTGSHAFKAGVQLWPGSEDSYYFGSGPYAITLLNSVPTSVTYFADPRDIEDYFFRVGVFAQDQWTLRRLTINAGLRFDSHDAGYPDQTLVATMGLPERKFPAKKVHAFRDLSPRLGVAWDLFGNGRTAVKASVNRYISDPISGIQNSARLVTPGYVLDAGLTRAWKDLNGDYVPQGDPLNPLPNGELIAPTTNKNFGTPILTTRDDPSWALGGWGVRTYNWSYSADIQHQLLPQLGLDFAYFYRTFGNQTITDNTLVGPADYDPYCVTSPLDARLPGGGGERICGLYDLNPAKVGLVDNMTTLAKNFGKTTQHNNGLELSFNTRLRQARVLGGVSALKSLSDNCDVVSKVDNPSTRFCRQESPYLFTWKLFGSYSLPWDMTVSGTFQATPGAQVSASWVVVNSLIKPSLGRDLSAGRSNVSVNLVEPRTLYRGAVSKTDLRFAKALRRQGWKANLLVDCYNAFNQNPAPAFNTTYGTNGATWLFARSVLSPRLFKFGLQFEF